jgi:hypothetical protein
MFLDSITIINDIISIFVAINKKRFVKIKKIAVRESTITC